MFLMKRPPVEQFEREEEKMYLTQQRKITRGPGADTRMRVRHHQRVPLL
jgi:hypothetical protein